MKILTKICQVIDTFNDVLGRILSFSILGIVAIIMCEVILRRFLNMPQIWTTDLITMIFGCYTILILPLGLQYGTFVCVDVLVQKVRAVKAHWLHLITSLLLQVPFVYYLVPRSLQFFLKSLSNGERGYSVWAPILWPVKLCLVVGLVLLAIQVISELLKESLWIASYYGSGKKEPEPIRSMSILNAETTK